MSADPNSLPAPLARRLTNWPAKPPGFDAIEPGTELAKDLNQLDALESIDDLPTLIEQLTRANVNARRHDSPDLIEQLRAATRRPLDTVICSVLDVDPTAAVQSATAAENPKALLGGLAMLARLVRTNRTMLIINRRTPARWLSPLRTPARGGARSAIKIIDLENEFPQADPTLLLFTLLGRKLRPGRLPTEAGVLLLDAVAAVLVAQAIASPQKSLARPIAVRDHDRSESFFLGVSSATSVATILNRIGVDDRFESNNERDADLLLRRGDLLRDRRVTAASLIGDGELVLHISTVPPAVNPDPCIRCGWCFETCPTQVQPANLLEAAQREDLEMGNAAGLKSCIECGICTYVCPSQLPILHGIRLLRETRAAGEIQLD